MNRTATVIIGFVPAVLLTLLLALKWMNSGVPQDFMSLLWCAACHALAAFCWGVAFFVAKGRPC